VTLAFYLDEDAMRNSLLRGLRSRGIDVVSALHVGLIGASDEENLAFATQQNRVLFSFNVADFCRIHTDWLAGEKRHSGIVLDQQRRQRSVGTLMQGLLRLGAQNNPTEMLDRLEFLSDWI
jgi:hypothetical protein